MRSTDASCHTNARRTCIVQGPIRARTRIPTHVAIAFFNAPNRNCASAPALHNCQKHWSTDKIMKSTTAAHLGVAQHMWRSTQCKLHMKALIYRIRVRFATITATTSMCDSTALFDGWGSYFVYQDCLSPGYLGFVT